MDINESKPIVNNANTKSGTSFVINSNVANKDKNITVHEHANMGSPVKHGANSSVINTAKKQNDVISNKRPDKSNVSNANNNNRVSTQRNSQVKNSNRTDGSTSSTNKSTRSNSTTAYSTGTKKTIKSSRSISSKTIMRVKKGAIKTLEKEANKDASTENGYTTGVAVTTGTLKSQAQATSLKNIAKTSKAKAVKSISGFKKSTTDFKLEKSNFSKANATVKKAKGTNPLQKQLAKKSIIKKSASKARAKALAKAGTNLAKSIKYAITAIKNMITVVASSSVSMLFTVLAIGIVAVIFVSPFGIMFSNDDGALTDVINEVNDEYWNRIDSIRSNNHYNSLELSGTPVEWKDVLLIYCATYSEATADEAVVFAQLDDVAKDKLKDIFWDMCSINYWTESETYEHRGQSYTYITLIIDISSYTAIEYAQVHNFTTEQFQLIEEMSDPQYDSLWSELLRGTSSLLVNFGDMPYYNQNDYSYPYGDDTIAGSGCGPTCFAMVASYLTATEITPIEVVKWAGNSFYVPHVGTSWNFFSVASNNWGISLDAQTSSISEAVQALQEGKVVISSQSPGYFTSGGHFIVLRGITADGKILVSDPNGGNANRWGMTVEEYLNKQWTPSEISLSGTQYWIFSSDLLTGGNVARQVWNYLTSKGYSEEVAAGIIGNMMRECGGDTLDLQWNLHGYYNGDTFYGLCMWCLRYAPSIDGASVIGQLNYLESDIRSQFDTFGYLYEDGFNYIKFKRLRDPEEVAVAFAVCYERPGYEANNYQLRRQNAVVAYNTFKR